MERIEGLSNVEVIIGVEFCELEGVNGLLDAIRLRNNRSGSESRRPMRQLFSFVGAEPNTDWLRQSGLKVDSRGFVCTGEDAGEGRLPLENSRRGVFAVGDVRAGSVKRVAAAVGDGAQVVAALHACFAEIDRSQAAIQPATAEVAR